MSLPKFLKWFHAADDGAITVDWVVLTSALVGLGVMAGALIASGNASLTSEISSNMASQTVGTN